MFTAGVDQAAAVESQRTPISNLTDSLGTYTAGRLTSHRLHFTLPDSLPIDAQIQITFPTGLALDSVSSVAYSDTDPGNTDPVLTPTQIIDQTLRAVLDSTGTPAAPGSVLMVDVQFITNDTIAGDYAITLSIFARDTSLLFGPTQSAPFTIEADTAVSLTISPATPQSIAAGASILFTTDARDRYGNRVDTLTVNYRVEPLALGVVNGAVFTGRLATTGRIMAESGVLADTSGQITVIPGALAQWDVAGVPAMVTAGAAPSAGNITATARDAYGNRIYNHTGTLYFDANDPSAIVPATPASPYTFKVSDSGRAVFDRTALRLYVAGTDTLRTIGGGATAVTAIHVIAAPASNFTVSAPASVIAGTPFTVTIASATDPYGNTASGTVTLTLNPGDSLSPGGQAPVLPQISVANGTGTAPITLVLAGSYAVYGRGAGARIASNTITIMPGVARRFDWLFTGSLVSGVPFPPVATLTAYDILGNQANNYDPGGTPVVLSAVNGDSMSNNVLGSGTFSAGVADLAALNVTYHGRGGQVRFAAGAGPALGTSEPVTVIALRADTLRFDQTSVRRGTDTLTGSVIANVNGAGSVTITGIELTTPYGDFPLANITPFLPNSVSGPATREYLFRWPVPASLPMECIDIGVRITGDFSAAAVSDHFQGGPCVTVTSSVQLSAVGLTPDPVAYAPVEYRATIANAGPGDLQVVLDSLVMIVTDSAGATDTAMSAISGQQLLAAASQITVPLQTQHAAPFAGDSAFATMRVIGYENGKRLDTSIRFAQPIHLVQPAQLSYFAGSLTPDTLLAGAADTLRMRIANSGGVAIEQIDNALTYLRLTGASDTITIPFDAAQTPLATFPVADTSLAFVLSEAASRVTPGTYTVAFTITGMQSNRPCKITDTLSDGLVFVGPAILRIDSVWATAPNLPFVSTAQDFEIHAAVSNIGNEPVGSVVLRLAADAGALFTDTVAPGLIFPAESAVATWPVTADVSPVSLETFIASVKYAVGIYTLKLAAVAPPLDDQAAVQVQTPALLTVELTVVSPPEAADLRIAAGSEFVVAAHLLNSGDAQTNSADLVLTAPANIGIDSPAVETVVPGGEVYWTLTAPAADTTGYVVVSFLRRPVELNTNTVAPVTLPSPSLSFQFAFETPPLVVFNPQFQSGLLTGSQPALTFDWTNPDASDLFPILLRKCAFGVVAAAEGTPRSPAGLFSAAQLQVGTQTFNGVLSDTAIIFGADSLLRIAPGDTQSVSLSVTPKSTAAAGDFRLITRAGIWSAIERSTDGAGLPVAIEDESGRTLNLQSPVLYRTADHATCYPNPFRAGSESVRIQYRLAAAAAASVTIYTAAGVEVWTHEYPAGGAGGQSGDNEITWDGRNGRGSVVFDGVYFLRLTAAGLDETLKVVVMK